MSLRGMVELRGTRRPGDPVTAAWNYQTILSGATIVAGVKLENINGTVESRGKWGRPQRQDAGNASPEGPFLSGITSSRRYMDHSISTTRSYGSDPPTPLSRSPLCAHEKRIPNEDRLTARRLWRDVLS